MTPMNADTTAGPPCVSAFIRVIRGALHVGVKTLDHDKTLIGYHAETTTQTSSATSTIFCSFFGRGRRFEFVHSHVSFVITSGRSRKCPRVERVELLLLRPEIDPARMQLVEKREGFRGTH